MMKIITISTLYPNPVQPGFGGFVARQTKGLAARDDIDLRVIAPLGLPPWPIRAQDPRRTLPQSDIWDDIPVYRPRFTAIPYMGWLSNPWAIWRACLPVMRDLRAQGFDCDAIDAEFFYPCGVAAMWLARAFNKPLSIKARGSDIALWGTRAWSAHLIRQAGRAADGLLCVSADTRQNMIRLGLPPNKIKVHYTGVDLTAFHPGDRAERKKKWGITGPLVVSAGNLVPSKGHDILIDAVARLDGVNLLIAGDGPLRADLQARIQAHGADQRIRLLGATPHRDMPDLLGAGDMFALASAREGLANAWVEAMACGLPLIIAQTGSAHEVINDPRLGTIIPRRVEDFAQAIKARLTGPAPDTSAIHESAKRFSWDRNSQELHDHLCAIIARHGTGRA